jgi:hypothetical protein
MKNDHNILPCCLCAIFLLLALCPMAVQAAPTTAVYLVKVAEDGETIQSGMTVTYEWMEDNLPVLGDGVTHYYHQGPVFEGDKWDPGETTNFKDRGAVRGTDVRDLAELVGGMEPGDEVMITAADGYHVEFGYVNVYDPDPRQGPIGLCWYNGEESGAGERQGSGYVPEYYNGMRLVFFADSSVNAEGLHVFGNWDMHETLPEASQHFYDLKPSTGGLNVKWVSEIRVYTGGYTGEKSAPVKSLQDTPAPVPAPTESPGSLVAALGGCGCAVLLHGIRRRP